MGTEFRPPISACLCHRRFLHLRASERGLRGRSAEPQLENILGHEGGRGTPEGELGGAKDDIRACSTAYGASAEEELADEDGQSDEASKIEQNVQGFSGKGAIGVDSCFDSLASCARRKVLACRTYLGA